VNRSRPAGSRVAAGRFGVIRSLAATVVVALLTVSPTALAGRGSSAPLATTGPASVEVLEGVAYCGGGAIKRQISFEILDDPQEQWNARVTIDGETIRAMTAYSYFGKSEPPRGFVVALLGEDRSEILVFREGDDDWLELGDYSYRRCD